MLFLCVPLLESLILILRKKISQNQTISYITACMCLACSLHVHMQATGKCLYLLLIFYNSSNILFSLLKNGDTSTLLKQYSLYTYLILYRLIILYSIQTLIRTCKLFSIILIHHMCTRHFSHQIYYIHPQSPENP